MKLRRVVMGHEEAEAAVTVLRAVRDQKILVEHDQDKLAHAIEAIDVAPMVDGDKSELDPTVQQLGNFARESETSRQGALANYPRSGSQRARVLMLLLDSDERGMTREELEQATGLTGNTIRPRVRELVTGGWARKLTADDGAVAIRRKTHLDNWSEVLVATDKAKRRRAQEKSGLFTGASA